MATTRGGLLVIVGLALLMPTFTLGSGPARAGDDAKGEATRKECRPVVDETKVYLGKAATCRAPAVVDADKVFKAIPEYKRILEKKLTDKDAEYSMLLLKANQKFKSAIEGAAKDGSYDLVANVGAVTWEGHTVPEITETALKKVAANP